MLTTAVNLSCMLKRLSLFLAITFVWPSYQSYTTDKIIPKETSDIQNVFKSFSFGNEDLWTLGLTVSHHHSNNYFLLLERIYLSQGTQDTLPSRLMVYLKFLEKLFNTMPFSLKSHPLLNPWAYKPPVGSKFICPLCISLKFLRKPGSTRSTSFNATPGILSSHLFSPSWFPGRGAGDEVTMLRNECSFCTSGTEANQARTLQRQLQLC